MKLHENTFDRQSKTATRLQNFLRRLARLSEGRGEGGEHVQLVNVGLGPCLVVAFFVLILIVWCIFFAKAKVLRGRGRVREHRSHSSSTADGEDAEAASVHTHQRALKAS